MIAKCNPFSRLTLRRPSRAAPLSEAPGNSVQCEFSLDHVKVVRNDLSDLDVEVAPVKSAPRSKAPAASRERSESPLAESKTA
jgi:hypothetical protein